jgi:uncharacterized protein (DUF983 family)
MTHADYQIEAIAKGHHWECPCGELFKEYSHAKQCRKCRKYLVDFDDRDEPVDLRLVGGKK